MKRGQITIFIVLAVILVGAILILFSINNKSQNILGFGTGNIESFVGNCIKQTGTEVIYQVGNGGGYYFPPDLSTASGVTYYYANGKNYMPSKQDIEKEISFYIERKLFFCTKNFVNFPDFNISQGDIKIDTKIGDNSIELNVNYPLSILKDKNTKLIENFDTEIPIRLGVLYDSASEFEKKSYEATCLSCLSELSQKNDFFVDMMDYGQDSTIFIFRDERSKIDDKPFRFVFANKYEIKGV